MDTTEQTQDAGWRGTVAKASLALSIFTVFWFIAAALGTKLGLWGWQFGLGTMTIGWGPFIAFTALGLAAVALVIGFIKAPRTQPVILGLAAVLIALMLMAISNLSFAMLAAAGHSNVGMAGAIGFENFASGYGGVVVVAYFSALCDLRFTAAQYALISAGASIVGRFLTGTTAGSLIEGMGYVNFYLLTTVAALPGIVLFWWMMRTGLVDAAMGTAGEVGEGDARA